jgi:hypothetical protein
MCLPDNIRAREFVIDEMHLLPHISGVLRPYSGRVKTENIHPFKTRQGDIGLLNIFEKDGLLHYAG